MIGPYSISVSWLDERGEPCDHEVARTLVVEESRPDGTTYRTTATVERHERVEGDAVLDDERQAAELAPGRACRRSRRSGNRYHAHCRCA